MQISRRTLFGPSRFLRLPVSVLILLIVCAGAASAMVFLHEDNLHISNLHRIEDDVYAYAESMTVDGFVDGELVAFVYSFHLNGDVTGTANVFAYQLNHRGRVERSLRGFANTAIIDGSVGHSLLLVANDLTVNRSAVVGRSARLLGNNLHMYGTVNGDAYIAGNSILIEGTIDGDLELRVGKHVEIAPTAVITGGVNYHAAEEDMLEIGEGATITGEVTWIPPQTDEDEGALASIAGIILVIAKLLAAFLFGVILVAVFRRHAEESLTQLRSRMVVSIAVGFLVLIGFALAAVIFVVALVLVITGLILVSGSNVVLGAFLLIFSTLALPISSFASVSAAIVLYSGKIVVGFLIGALLLRRPRSSRVLNGWNLLVGLILLFALFAIPYLGVLVYLLVGVTGAGAIVLGVRNCRRPSEVTAAAVPPTPPAPPRPTPPPPTPPPTIQG